MLPPKDTGWLNGYKNKTHTYAVYKRHTLYKTKSDENKRMEKDRLSKEVSKESLSGYTNIKQNSL